MASKYMAAKRLAKQMAKNKKHDVEEKQGKGSIHANAGEFLDRRKQKFDMSQSSMQVDGDFEIEDDEEEVNKKFNQAYEHLRKKDDHFFLSYNENYIENEEETDSENEATKIQDMRYKAETQSKSIMQQVEGSVNESQASYMDDSVLLQGESSQRALLPGDEKDKDKPPEQSCADTQDKQVAKLKEKINFILQKQQDQITHRHNWIIESTTSVFMNYFEYLVMILAIWNAVWTPLTIAYEIAADIGEGPVITGINFFVDFIFICDIVLGFLNSYVD